MNLIVVYGFLVLGVGTVTKQNVMVLGIGPMLVPDNEIPTKKCRYSKAYSMLQVTCRELDLEDIPRDLKTDIQVLDATKNRIRDLTNTSLAPYKSLAYIYLQDNFIQNIEENAFANQYYLEVLDLTKNGCKSLPRSLFQLPYLRKVYLEKNMFDDSSFDFEITSPLTFLHLAKNQLTKIPRLGILPRLTYLNLSNNMISGVTAEDLAPFCSLQTLDLSKNMMDIKSSCGCRELTAWLQVRGITTKPSYNCSDADMRRCGEAPVEFGNRTLELYESCRDVLREQIATERARTTWILVASCVTVFIVCVFLVLYCIHRRNSRRRRKLKEQQRLTVNNANMELLNSNLQSDGNA